MKCDFEGCTGEAREWTHRVYKPPKQEPRPCTHSFCEGHAREFGFCTSCGGYFAGTSVFDKHELCESCLNEQCEEAEPIGDLAGMFKEGV